VPADHDSSPSPKTMKILPPRHQDTKEHQDTSFFSRSLRTLRGYFHGRQRKSFSCFSRISRATLSTSRQIRMRGNKSDRQRNPEILRTSILRLTGTINLVILTTLSENVGYEY
jgi:hypothetical protein